MDITPIIPADRQVIDGYGEGQFCIRSEWRPGPVIVFPNQTIAWDVTDFAGLTVASFTAVIEAEPKVEILLLGSGPKMQLLPGALRRDLRASGVIVDVMDTGAACRTYNVLLAEGRRVAAALLPV